jgi:hypothetical protein
MQWIAPLFSFAALLLASSVFPSMAAAQSKPAASPGPKIYHFDIRPSAEAPRDDGRTRIADARSARVADDEPRMVVGVGQVEPASLRLQDEARPIDEAPRPPSYDLPPPEGAGPLPFLEYAPLPWQAGYLGGIPTFTHEYCPRYWDDPWQGYCAERWRAQFGQACHVSTCQGVSTSHGVSHCVTPTTDGYRFHGEPRGEAPLPEPDDSSPSDRMKRDQETSAPPEPYQAPTHRRPPRNQLPPLDDE